MSKKEQIDHFLKLPLLAVAGVSSNPKKFGSIMFRELKKKGFNVLPLNPNLEVFEGDTCYQSINDLPDSVAGLVCVAPATESAGLLQQAHNKGIEYAWLQQGTETAQALQVARENNMQVVSGECLLMFADPVQSVHKFHRLIWKWLGKLPN